MTDVQHRHKPPGYTGLYTEITEAEGLPKVCIDEGYFVIWQSYKIEIPSTAEQGLNPIARKTRSRLAATLKL